MATRGAGDLRLALRTLVKERGLAVLAIVTLALGIGANTAIFSVIDAVLLRPLPYPDADRLVQVWNTYPLMDLPEASVSVPDYFDRREGVSAFDESALYHYVSVNLAGSSESGASDGASAGAPQRVVGLRATASLFPLLRAHAEVGRVFTPAEDRPGEEHVAVLSHHLWQRAFGSDPSVVGREVRLNGEGYRVVGVMPESFAFPHPRVDLWTPFAPTPEQRSDQERGREFSQMVARLAPGPTPAEGVRLAQEQIDAIHERNKERIPEAREFWETSGFGGLVVPLKEERYGHLRPLLLLLQGVVALVLLIACVNVANLMLTRLSRRQKELAVRTALGADRWSLTRLLLVESLVLSLAGGIAGVLLGVAGARAIPYLAPDLIDFARPGDPSGVLGLDPTVLAFTLGLALLTGLLFGLAPVVSLWRSETSSVLRDEGRGAGGNRRSSRLRQALVVIETALALVLLAGAGLLLRTFWTLQDENPGFVSAGVLTARVALPDAKYPEPADVATFYEQSLAAVRALPGVRSAGLVSDTPFSGHSSSASYQVVGYETGPDEPQPHGLMRVVDESYFRTMGITLLAGRTFETLDDADAEPVVVVDRRLVEKYFDGADPSSALDGRLSQGGGDDAPTYRIVGVVAPVKIQTLDKPITKETIYLPFRQNPSNTMTFVLRTDRDPAALTEPLRRAVLSVDPEQPVYEVRTMAEQVGESLTGQRVSMLLVALFGALALVLAAVGIYGVLAFSTAQREREIGTRMALGASSRKILGLVVGEGMLLCLLGVGLGAGLAIGLGRLVRSMLFGVAPWDPVSYLAAAVLLLAVAFLACYRPARRAAHVDPAEALRSE